MVNLVTRFDLEVYIEGECVDLCIPTEQFAGESSWHKWFNNKLTTRFLEQGMFPNTPAQQLQFYNDLNDQQRLSLIISDKEQYVGTISLSSINLYKRTAEIALLFGEKSKSSRANLLALESMSLVTTHAFEQMGLKRISAGQHASLSKWQNRMELIGYRLEGIKKRAFIKGNEVADSVTLATTLDDYQKILSVRNKLWDSYEMMLARISDLPSIKFADLLNQFLEEEGSKYYDKIFKL